MHSFPVRESHLEGLRSVGHHLMRQAREEGGDTAKPLAFVGLVTIAIGAMMLLKANRQMERRSL
jgi:hypothetical protein